MFFDYHVHSNFSPDGSMSMDECISHAIDKNIEEMCFTDHLDIDFPAFSEENLDYEKYSSSIDEVRKKYEGRIKINKGIEIGMQPHIINQIYDYIDGKKFDFIIGSIHVVNGHDICDSSFYEGKSKKEVYNEYLDALYTCIKAFKDFNVLGHIDIIKRYCHFEDRNMYFEEFGDYITPIYKELIQSGRGIEINTSGIRYKVGSAHPTVDLLKAYRNLGGEIITTGSDSHSYEYLAYNFGPTLDILRDCGFKYITIFRDRKPVQIKI